MDGGALRNEIIESQKFTVDLEKWKIVLVAALGAAALGIVDAKQQRNYAILLALIPLVCAYVDVLVYHNGLRIMVIAAFLRRGETNKDPFATEYERFCKDHRGAFPLEELALFNTTLLLSVAVGLVAYNPALALLLRLDDCAARWVVFTGAIFGVVSALSARSVYLWRLEDLKNGEAPSGSKIGRALWRIVPTIVVALLWLGAATAVQWLFDGTGLPGLSGCRAQAASAAIAPESDLSWADLCWW